MEKSEFEARHPTSEGDSPRRKNQKTGDLCRGVEVGQGKGFAKGNVPFVKITEGTSFEGNDRPFVSFIPPNGIGEGDRIKGGILDGARFGGFLVVVGFLGIDFLFPLGDPGHEGIGATGGGGGNACIFATFGDHVIHLAAKEADLGGALAGGGDRLFDGRLEGDRIYIGVAAKFTVTEKGRRILLDAGGGFADEDFPQFFVVVIQKRARIKIKFPNSHGKSQLHN